GFMRRFFGVLRPPFLFLMRPVYRVGRRFQAAPQRDVTGVKVLVNVGFRGVFPGGFRRIMVDGVRALWAACLSSLRAVAWFDTLLVWVLVAVFRMVRNVACLGSCGRVSNRSRCRLSGFLRGRSEPGGAAKRSRPFGLPSPPAPDRAAAELAGCPARGAVNRASFAPAPIQPSTKGSRAKPDPGG